ncbi:GTPase activating protein [Atractiella rhizophila]|nr:GTPase activating protein [Atractiella rhizophila]
MGLLVPQAFDESVLRNLVDLDCGMPLMLDRLKQDISSCREVSGFLKKRALIEEEYGRNMIKAAKTSLESYAVSDSKAGTFVSSYNTMLRLHEILGENRIKVSSQLNDMAEEILALSREVEKSRKSNKETGMRLEKNLIDCEAGVDKAKVRFDSASEDLERLLVMKAGESIKDPLNLPHSPQSQALSGSYFQTAAQGGTQKRTLGKALGKIKNSVSSTSGKSPSQIARLEEEARNRTSLASDAYRQEVLKTQKIRQEWFNLQLPRLLRTLKESMDECEMGLQYYLLRYAWMFEKALVDDAGVVSPLGGIEEGPGLKAVAESVDNLDDFKNYMQNYVIAYGMTGAKGPRREGPPEEGFLPPPSQNPRRPSMSPPQPTQISQPSLPPSNKTPPITKELAALTPQAPSAKPTFGVDLAEQMSRDGVEVPRVLEKCCEVIEEFGLDTVGIYRLSGTTSRIQRLKQKLDKDVEAVDLRSEENLSDINDITGVLKLWIRELPEPLLTWELYDGFIDAAKIENDRLRHIRLHERVNDLPDPNYAALRYLMGHLHKVRQKEAKNSMTVSNLAIVFGPNLLGPPSGEEGVGGIMKIQDMQWQCRAVETILEHYVAIFVEEEGS